MPSPDSRTHEAGNFWPVPIVLVDEGAFMIAFFLWCILFVLCWPVAVLALVLYPLVWLLLLPFRILGFAVHGVLAIVWAVVVFPFRLLRAPFRLA